MNFAARAAMALAMAGLTSCASIVDGTNQSLSLTTTDDSGAQLAGADCALKNGKGIWYVTTPGSVTVHQAYSALDISCTKSGYQTATDEVQSSMRPMYAGNIVFGGIIGLGTDAATGAAYQYPQAITVPMHGAPAPAPAPTPAPVAATQSAGAKS